MTLVLTELTNTGIAMAADSAITKIRGGKIVEVDQEGWLKLLPVPSLKAAVSYWGMIGAVTRIRFDDWLNRVISSGSYSDLSSFADCLVDALNNACHNRPLADGQAVGIHVAGYAEWADGQKRPFLYHVHNGHLAIEVNYELANSGEQQHVVAVHPKLVSDPRKLFEKHQDFPYPDSLDRSLQDLEAGHITRNGDYFFYTVIWEQMQQAFNYINLIPGVSIPRDPLSLNSRKGMLHTALEIMVRIYRCSNQSRIVGGTVTSLGIGPRGYIR